MILRAGLEECVPLLMQEWQLTWMHLWVLRTPGFIVACSRSEAVESWALALEGMAEASPAVEGARKQRWVDEAGARKEEEAKKEAKKAAKTTAASTPKVKGKVKVKGKGKGKKHQQQRRDEGDGDFDAFDFGDEEDPRLATAGDFWDL
jgi:hypothetical protein